MAESIKFCTRTDATTAFAYLGAFLTICPAATSAAVPGRSTIWRRIGCGSSTCRSRRPCPASCALASGGRRWSSGRQECCA